jgi:ParB family chromosome partitioning protein
MFGDLSDEELASLAEDMAQHGQRQPVEVLPDGTVIAGHQRVRAARLLGWSEVEVVVRADLAEQGDAAVEAALISDNLVRRHLSTLARARCIGRLFEIEHGRSPGGLNRGQVEKLKARIAAKLGVSLRTVNRYLLALKAPRAVQWALDHDEISLITAGKVALLDEAARKAVARRIKGGEKPGTVIAEALPKPRRRYDNTIYAVRSFARLLARGRMEMEGQLDELSPDEVRPHLEELRQTETLIKDLIELAGE